MTESKHLLLIDLPSIWHPAWHSSADQDLSAAYQKTVERVHSTLQHYKADHVAICLDAPPYAHRKALLESYKSQRDAPPPDMVEQYRRVQQRLTDDALLLWKAQGFEADDVIATATRMAVDEAWSVTIVSADKDLVQLVDDDAGVVVYSPSSQTTYNRETVISKFGVSPDLIADMLALMGDKSDNVPGVAGCGPKNAARLLLEFGSLHEVLANADQQTPKLAEALIADAEKARVARKLVTLRADAPIEWKDLFVERKAKPLSKPIEPEEDEVQEDEEFDSPDFISTPKPASAPGNAKPKSEPPPPPTRIETRQQSIVVSQNAAPVEWEMQLEPTSLSLAYKMAGDLLNSRLFSKFTNQEAIFAVIIRGREMGLGAMTALAVMTFFEGKVALDAHYIVSKAKQHPDCEYFQYIGGDHTYAEWETKNRRNPKPTKMKYTIEQAKLAGLCRAPAPGKQEGNWIRRPAEMLRKTAAVQLVRVEYPSAALGLVCPEEIGEEAA